MMKTNRNLKWGEKTILVENGNYPIHLIQNIGEQIPEVFEKHDISSIRASYKNQEIPRYYLALISSIIESDHNKDALKAIDVLFSQTSGLLRATPTIQDNLDKTALAIELLKLFKIRNNLEKELEWAFYEQKMSKSSLYKDRYGQLNQEIQELTTKIDNLKPNHDFIVNRHSELNETKKGIKEDLKKLNKEYMVKTSEVNKLSRDIDKINSRYGTYAKKLEEIESKLKNSQSDHTEKDYNRVKNKADSEANKIANLKTKKQNLKIEIKNYRNRISALKKKVKSLSRELKKVKPKFEKYTDIMNGLKSDILKKEQQYQELQAEIFDKSNENDKFNKPDSSRPELIRFSENIKSDISTIDDKINILYERVFQSTQDEIDIAQLSKVVKQTDKIISEHIKFAEPEEIELIFSQFVKFTELIQNILKDFDMIMKNADFSLNFPNLPVQIKELEQEKNMKSLQSGINFTVIQNKKEIAFNELLNREKLLIGFMIEFLFNYHSERDTAIISDSILESRWLSKPNVQYIVDFYNQNVLKQEKYQNMLILIGINKEKFNKKELENVNIINYKDC